MSLVTHLNSGTRKAGVLRNFRNSRRQLSSADPAARSRRSAVIWSACLTRLEKLAFTGR